MLIKVEFEGHVRDDNGNFVSSTEDSITIEVASNDIDAIQPEVERQYGEAYGSFYLNRAEVVDPKGAH